MLRTEIEKLIKEYEEAESSCLFHNKGKLGDDWKEKMVHADRIDGVWYWKGHKVSDLYKEISKMESANE